MIRLHPGQRFGRIIRQPGLSPFELETCFLYTIFLQKQDKFVFHNSRQTVLIFTSPGGHYYEGKVGLSLQIDHPGQFK
jgi:hypothetical protein